MSRPARDPRIAFFDAQAATWDTDGPAIGTALARLDALAPTLALQPGHDVLEVGCGTGQVTRWLAQQVRPGRVTAVDFSPAMIAHARGEDIDADFRCVDVCSDDLPTSCFDVVFCMHAFPHFRDKPAALRNMSGALRPGGRLIVLHLRSSQKVNAFHDQVGGAIAGDHLPTPSVWPVLLEQAALKITQVIEPGDLFLLIAHTAASTPEQA
ncbi:MAG TPA: class I SAM-dependent methyltransferase [Phycisphaerae bacterium]|nr:class I SAM-dependent methyltransferase [Phycisphaerae bacterium]